MYEGLKVHVIWHQVFLVPPGTPTKKLNHSQMAEGCLNTPKWSRVDLHVAIQLELSSID